MSAALRAWYNEEHRHSAIGFVTPGQRHARLDTAILQQRHDTYTQARSERPERWTGRAARTWEPVAQVWLNPEREMEVTMIGKMMKVA